MAITSFKDLNFRAAVNIKNLTKNILTISDTTTEKKVNECNIRLMDA